MRAMLLTLLLAAPLLAAAPAAALPAEVCFLEILGPDLLVRYCADPANPRCLVYADRWGHEGEYLGRTCVVP
ncbi:MAG TPA: hypothetical protein VNX21_02625 [Candidatus Thermoplasmatota archaeon]|nr:hypothetical protein [Candidatus Thermoplasmatota archaeon]